MLSNEQIEFYNENGYVAVEAVFENHLLVRAHLGGSIRCEAGCG